MKQYLDLLKDIIDNGHNHEDRTKVGRRSVYGRQLRFNLQEGFPLVTTRQIFTRAFIEEMLWFIQGKTNIQELKDNNINIWNNWAVSEEHIDKFIKDNVGEDQTMTADIKKLIMEKAINEIGPMYGYNWRHAPLSEVRNTYPVPEFNELPSDKVKAYAEMYKDFEQKDEVTFEDFCINIYMQSIDQLNDLIINLKKQPFSARHIVTAWIPEYVPFEAMSPQDNVLIGKGALAACHAFFQCFVTPSDNGEKNKLSMLMYQRSVDSAVGAPFNIAQYSLLLTMIAQVVDMEPYEFIWTTGDTHIYFDQLEKAKEQVLLEPKALCKLELNPEIKDLFAFTFDDIKILDYHYHPKIVYPVSI